MKLWQDLMGTTVYDSGESVREGAHVYCQSYKQDPSKKCYLIINNSGTETTTLDIPVDGQIWVLTGKDGNKRASVMTLNSRDLVLGDSWQLPDLSGAPVAAGTVELPPCAAPSWCSKRFHPKKIRQGCFQPCRFIFMTSSRVHR